MLAFLDYLVSAEDSQIQGSLQKAWFYLVEVFTMVHKDFEKYGKILNIFDDNENGFRDPTKPINYLQKLLNAQISLLKPEHILNPMTKL